MINGPTIYSVEQNGTYKDMFGNLLMDSHDKVVKQAQQKTDRVFSNYEYFNT